MNSVNVVKCEWPNSIPLLTEVGPATIDVIGGSRFRVSLKADVVYQTRGGVRAEAIYRCRSRPWDWVLDRYQVERANDPVGLARPVRSKSVGRVIGAIDGAVMGMIAARPPWIGDLERLELDNNIAETEQLIRELEDRLWRERELLVALRRLRGS